VFQTFLKAHRLNSDRKATQALAEKPSLFGEIRHPDKGEYLIIPRTSSERRRFIPIGFADMGTVASDNTLIMPNGTLVHFGVLSSTMHMAWVRTVCGRLKSDYRYSAEI